jgi:hypothetical protein
MRRLLAKGVIGRPRRGAIPGGGLGPLAPLCAAAWLPHRPSGRNWDSCRTVGQNCGTDPVREHQRLIKMASPRKRNELEFSATYIGEPAENAALKSLVFFADWRTAERGLSKPPPGPKRGCGPVRMGAAAQHQTKETTRRPCTINDGAAQGRAHSGGGRLIDPRRSGPP